MIYCKFLRSFVLSIVIIQLLLYAASTHAFSAVVTYQDTTRIRSSDKAEQLLKDRQYDVLIKFCKQELSKFLNKKEKDSIEIARLSYYQFEGQYKQKYFLESIKSANLGIAFSKNTEEGLSQKGMLYYKKAYAQEQLFFVKRSLKSMEKASHILSQLKNTNFDYSIGAYNFISQKAAYNGNLEDAKRYLRLSENLYIKNKEALDLARTEADGNYDRYDVILPYKNIYLLYKQGTTRVDSLQIIKHIDKLEALHKAPEFNAMYERVYYTTALNHVGDWYASYKPEEEISKAHLEKARYYIDKSIDFVDNKNYPGNKITFYFNKCKILTLSNDLVEADVLISKLLKNISDTDARTPFFLAQKGFIKAKKKQKDSALFFFYNAIKKVHSSDSILAKDYSNFKPNAIFGQTKLLLRIADKLNTFYEKDSDVQNTVAKLYYMAFLQFEHSYNSSKFNKTYNHLLRTIIFGILKLKEKGYGLKNIENEELINRFETVQNQLEWLHFNQNRYTNTLPVLDSLNLRKLTLRTQLAKVKREKHIFKQDSIHELIKNNAVDFKKAFPNLALFNEEHFDIKTLQRQLKPNDLVIKYLLLDNQFAVCSITNKDLNVELKPWTLANKNGVRDLIEGVKNQNFNPQLAEELAQVLLPKIGLKTNHIIINPDGLLCRLPFEILKVNGSLITEKYRVSYTSNLGFISPKVNQYHQGKGLAIYVPNYQNTALVSTTRETKSILTGAKQEAEAIAGLFPSTIYTGSNLSKKDFLVTAKQADLLHLAMHAEVNNDEPELSKLIFSRKNNDIENLYLEELYGLSLSANLAVLSACNTGLGKENAGKGMESFQRAFTFAGVPTTVASLWEVPDLATQQIMQDFYKYLSKGQVKSEALQNAKLKYLKKHVGSKLAQPYYWAGFVIYGEDKAISNTNSGLYWCLLLFLVIVITASVFFVKRRQSNKL